MPTRLATEVLYDSEAILRQVEEVLDELRRSAGVTARDDSRTALPAVGERHGRETPVAWPAVEPAHVHRGIIDVLAHVRERRASLLRDATRRAALSAPSADAGDAASIEAATARQLADAANFLLDTERRLALLATLFDAAERSDARPAPDTRSGS